MKKVFVLLFLMGCALPCGARMSPDFDSEGVTVAVAFRDSGSGYIDSLGRGWLGGNLAALAGWAALGLSAYDVKFDPQESSWKVSAVQGSQFMVCLATYAALLWVIGRLGSQELEFSKRNFIAFGAGMVGVFISPVVSLSIGIVTVASKFFKKSKVVILPKAVW